MPPRTKDPLLFSARVEFRRVPPEFTSRKSSKVHAVYLVPTEGGVVFLSEHDRAQNTAPEHRWPWNKPTERSSCEAFAAEPCLICEAALDGRALPGYV